MPCGRDITSLCHGIAILLLLHCLLLLMLLVTENWSDQSMDHELHLYWNVHTKVHYYVILYVPYMDTGENF